MQPRYTLPHQTDNTTERQSTSFPDAIGVCVSLNLAVFAKTINTMPSPPREFPTLSSYLGLDEEVIFGSDTNVCSEEIKMSNPTVPEVRPLSAPNPFVKRREATATMAQHHETDAGEHLIIKQLDEQQVLILQRYDNVRRRAQTKKVTQNRSGYVSSIPDVEGTSPTNGRP